jgi:hypothetical protein
MDWIADQIAIGNFLDANSLPAAIKFVLCLREDCSKSPTDLAARCIPAHPRPQH